MLFKNKMPCGLQNRGLLAKPFYENADSAPKALQRFRILENIRRGAMSANGALLELKDSIARHALNNSEIFFV